MARPPAPVHYLRPNDRVWTPGSVLYLDTETRTIPRTEPEVMTLRLWCLRLIDRRPTDSGRQEIVDMDGDTSAELAAAITDSFKGRKTLWLFAHNLSFDLVTTRLPLALVSAGWRISDAAVGGRAPWMRFSKGSKRLTVVDSGGWLPAALTDLAPMTATRKLSLPKSGDSRKAWLDRCRHDVAILADAMGQLMDWWDRDKLGRFDISGSACGWNAFRHVPSVQRIVVDPEPDFVAADRKTVHGGRRGVWRVGDIRAGGLLELDITAAYPGVAAQLPLPVRRAYPIDSLEIDDGRLTSDRWQFAGQVTIETDTPRWPVKWRGGTWYPTGTFTTHLAGPEIAEAVRLGCLRAVGPGHVHQLGGAMMPWARWILAAQRGEIDTVPPVAQVTAKHWGRVVIGKWASRGFDRVPMGASPAQGWGYEEGWDHATQTHGGMVDIAGQRWWVSSSAEPDNAYPAILAWVESHVRLRLSRVLDALGDDVAIQCDTDGLIVSERALVKWARGFLGDDVADNAELSILDRAILALNELTAPLTIRIKRRHSHARILGAQHIDLPTGRRFAGLPKHATRTGEDTYSGRIWPKLQWQMGNGDPRGYVRPAIEAVVAGPYAAGFVLTTGRVVPPMAVVMPDGSTDLLPWDMMPSRLTTGRLAPKQSPRMKTLIP